MTHNMTCAITDGYRPNDVDTVEGKLAKDLDALEQSFRLDVEIIRRDINELMARYEDDLGKLGGNFDLVNLIERFDEAALDEFYAAKRQAEG